MKYKTKIYEFLLISVLISLFVSCGKQDREKIPITTSSDKALQYYLKGREFQDKLRMPEAFDYFKKAIESDSNFALAYIKFAQVQPSLQGIFEQLDKATSLVDRVSEGEKYMILGFQANINQDPMKEKEYYEKLVKMYPNDERSYGMLGSHYFTQQDYNNAIIQYKKALKINKQYSIIWNQIGYCFRYLEKYESAEKAFKNYIRLIPDDPNPYDSYAELLLKMGEYEASLDQYEKALSQDSNFVASHIGIATNLNFISKHAEARQKLELFSKKIVNSGTKRDAQYAIAVSYADEGNLQKAIQVIEKLHDEAEKKNDFAAMAHDLLNIANILFEAGKYSKAHEKYKKALEKIQNATISEELKNNVQLGVPLIEALILSKKRDFSLANLRAQTYLQSVESSGNQRQIRTAHEALGRIALDEKNYKYAITELQKSNLQNPYNLYRIAIAYHGLGDRENTIKYLEKTVNFNALNSLDYAFCRNKAKRMLIDLQ